MPWTRKRAPLLLSLIALGVVMAVPAGAAAPTPCNGIFLTDAPDDGVFNPGGQADLVGATDGPAPENLEVLNTYVNSTGGQVTMNITLKNLTRDVPQGISSTGGNWYYGYFVYQDRVRFVRAANTGSGDITYAYGYVTSGDYGGDDIGGIYQTEGDTTGTFTEGPNGVVSIVIPPAIGGKNGETLGSLGGSAETIEGEDDFFGINHQADTAPDDYSITSPAEDGKSLTVTECPASGGGAAPTPDPGTGGGTPTPPPSSGGGSTPPPAAAPASLPLKAASTLGSAKKAKKKKSLIFKVKAGKPITKLKLALRPAKGGAPVGKATIKSLKQGSSKIKLKVTKKLKAGKYVLVANGVVDGRTLGSTQSVKVKK